MTSVVKVFLDGELQMSLHSRGFTHATKTKFGFTVNGESLEFDKLRVMKPLLQPGAKQ